jgi:hypothetical protein
MSAVPVCEGCGGVLFKDTIIIENTRKCDVCEEITWCGYNERDATGDDAAAAVKSSSRRRSSSFE